jgi:predicted RNA-binding protein associated with RNAse of E/G family
VSRHEQARITLDYRRLPDTLERFEQRLVAREDACVVTLLDAAPLARPVEVAGVAVLEPGAAVVWFTFPGAWHDAGRFHLRDGRFTGIYANVLTPVRGVAGTAWETTDLFLDVWLPARGGAPVLLDRDELAEAERRGWVEEPLATRARAEAGHLLEAAVAGRWPPPVVARWTLAAARDALRAAAPPRGS